MPEISDNARTQAINLFTYLRELGELRSKVVRRVDDYDKVLWFADVPKEQECYTPAWGASRTEDDDVWLEIKKPTVRPFPPVPKDVEPWVREVDLANSSDIPEILTKIAAPESPDEMDNNQTEPKFIELETQPHVRQQWDKYLEDKWLDWATEHERVKKVQSVYSTLHAIYQQQKKLGETFELVLGLGLLSWKTPSGQQVRRHLVVTQTSVELDGKRGTLIVSPGADGAKPTLEQDMLEASERPNPDEQTAAEKQLTTLGDAIWNNPALKEILQSWINSLSSSGMYEDGFLSPKEISEKPRVTLSPALILRRRSERSLITAFQDIINQLRSGIQIPFGIQRIVEVIDDHLVSGGESDSDKLLADFQEVLFPLPSNDEQNRIVETINTRQGVVVQGPPGTGKSHTIANLICHLLAAGKRVLVTSQTPRALKVLKGMMEKHAKEISPLCVSYLGNDSDALKELESSVSGITNKQHNWNARKNNEEIEDLKVTLHNLRKQEADLHRRIREIRERETYEHNVCNGFYRGTAQTIARQIRNDQPLYDWLEAKINTDTQPPLSDEEILDLLRLHRELTKDKVFECQKSLIVPDRLPTTEDFAKNHKLEAEAENHHNSFGLVLTAEIYPKLSGASQANLDNLKAALSRLLDTRANVLKHSQPWVPRAVDDILSERDRSWRELFNSSQNYLRGLIELARKADERKISLPQGYDRSVFIANAKSLLTHFANGGSIGLPLFRPKPVKDGWDIISKTSVNGERCNSLRVISELLETLEVEDRIEKLWSFWPPYAEKVTGGRSMQVGIIEDLCEPLEQALTLHSLMGQARDTCSLIQGLSQPAWHILDEIEHYHRTIQAIEAERSLRRTQAFFDETEQTLVLGLATADPNPLIEQMLLAVRNRDEITYGKSLTYLKSLYHDKISYQKRQILHRSLSRFAPTLAEQIEADPKADWDDKLSMFSRSWNWTQAKCWLEEYIEGANEPELVSNLQATQDEIRHTTSKLAAACAWKHCFSQHRLSAVTSSHLRAWTEAIKRGGKWTGKTAPQHRKDAQRHMEHCRDAIPAWIMPLYKVVENVKPKRDTYDVVIIDEASQSGPDALFLQFLAKKIIVVGDSEQISPQDIGVTADSVMHLRKKYLSDITHADALGLGSSFFSLSSILFSGRVVLREHFRCMPEIIQFSNDLCYQHSPLQPLRQYPPKRLRPVVAFHVKDGYREGGSQAARNLPEAEAIVEKIAECCGNPEYDCSVDEDHPYGKKTIGVISLLGEYQAREIERMLLEEIGPEEIAQRNIVCGDAYAFQGDERDIMFLSMVAAPGETQMMALVKEADKRRFNVAASRAKDQMWLFHTPSPNDFRNKECLRYKLLSYCLNPKAQQQTFEGIDIQKLRNDANKLTRKVEKPPKPFQSWFEVDTFLQVFDRGYRIIPQFKVAGYSIDLVIEDDQRRLAVECDGDDWHSSLEQREQDMRRQRILERCGWTFWRVRGSEFYFNTERAMESLWQTLEAHNILPPGRHGSVRTPATDTPINRTAQILNINERVPNESMNSRLDHALEWSQTRTHKESGFSSDTLQNSIIAVLQACPNNSCTKDSLTSRICKNLEFQTRGQNRIEFEKQVYRALNRLKSKGFVEEYTATNVRIRLISSNTQLLAFEDNVQR
jgi:superfamily I DNA and/or RNA helicase